MIFIYIWIGLILSDNDEERIRSICRDLNIKYNVSEKAFQLPQHISLKTSFYSEDYHDIADSVIEYLKDTKSFKVSVEDISLLDNKVIWFDIKETSKLRKLHNDLNDYLNHQFDITLNGFDGANFHFHSTLFQEEMENDKMIKLYDELKKAFEVPFEISLDYISVGISDSPKVGTYSIFKNISLNK